MLTPCPDPASPAQALDPWLAQLWPALLAKRPLPPGASIDERPELPPPRYAVEILDGPVPPPAAHAGPPPGAPPLGGWSAAVPFLARMAANELLTSGAAPVHEPETETRTRTRSGSRAPVRWLTARAARAGADREVRHFELELGDSGLSYAPGDIVAVQPRNRRDEVAFPALPFPRALAGMTQHVILSGCLKGKLQVVRS